MKKIQIFPRAINLNDTGNSYTCTYINLWLYMYALRSSLLGVQSLETDISVSYVLCHSRRDTLQNTHCSIALRVEYRSCLKRFCQ